MHDFEMFLAPGCLDGKAPKRIKDEIATKVSVLHAHLSCLNTALTANPLRALLMSMLRCCLCLRMFVYTTSVLWAL